MSATKPQARAQHVVGRLDDFPIGAMRIVTVEQVEIGVIRLSDGEVHAMRNYCPHKGAPICKGVVGGTWPPCEPGELLYGMHNEVLVCPWHGFEYNIRTGVELYQERPTRLRKYPVEVRGDEVLVTV